MLIEKNYLIITDDPPIFFGWFFSKLCYKDKRVSQNTKCYHSFYQLG